MFRKITLNCDTSLHMIIDFAQPNKPVSYHLFLEMVQYTPFICKLPIYHTVTFLWYIIGKQSLQKGAIITFNTMITLQPNHNALFWNCFSTLYKIASLSWAQNVLKSHFMFLARHVLMFRWYRHACTGSKYSLLIPRLPSNLNTM